MENGELKAQDKIVVGLGFDGMVRFSAAITTETVSEAVKVHELTPTAAAALGRSLTGVILMSNMLKNDSDKITLQIKGDGPLGGILVTGDRYANVKGYVDNPACDLPIRADGKIDVSGAVGRGYLQIIKDIGLKEPYIGKVNIVSGEIAEDLAHYFAVSEQINSAIGLGVLIGRDGGILKAGGYMIQLMPGVSEECISFLEKRLSQLPSVTSLINGEPESMVKTVFEGESISFLDSMPCGYRCGCSRSRMERNLISIGRDDLKELAEEQEETELVCHFCNEKYVFTSKELLDLAAL